MGNFASKDIKDVVDILEEENKKEEKPPSYKTILCDDPRSPTAGLDRTPIEIYSKRYVAQAGFPLRRCNSDPDLTPVRNRHSRKESYCVVIDDPRSPTLGIARTPIQHNCIVKGGLNSSITLEDIDIENSSMYSVDRVSHADIVSDCRSPSVGICRTPIEVEAFKDGKFMIEDSNENLNHSKNTSLETYFYASGSPSVLTFKNKLHHYAGTGPCVYEDLVADSQKEKMEPKSNQRENDSGKENDNTKRKLSFTPEIIRKTVKVRTPLGTLSNFQDSPSHMLKMKHAQKVDQELGNDPGNFAVDNVISIQRSSKHKKRPSVEWDSKDSTLIM